MRRCADGEIAGKIYTGDKDITADMFALDETVIELSRIELKEGTFPKKRMRLWCPKDALRPWVLREMWETGLKCHTSP